ncbi:MAG: TlpA family protein disulfide reductase [Aristaeellaceae bacterium]
MKKTLILLLALAMLVAVPAALAETSGLTSFSTYDMEAQPVDESIFSGYDLTMVNIWATWCGYCVQEMPELAKLKDMLPENVNLITICDDATTETELAYNILQQTGATNFQTLMGTQEIYDQFLYQVYAFPTTYFLDSAGNPVGEPVVGVPDLDDPAGTYYGIIQEVLAMLEDAA